MALSGGVSAFLYNQLDSNSNHILINLIHKTREPSLWTAHYFVFVEIDLKDHTNQVLTWPVYW